LLVVLRPESKKIPKAAWLCGLEVATWQRYQQKYQQKSAVLFALRYGWPRATAKPTQQWAVS
jgi:hypothetical protein